MAPALAEMNENEEQSSSLKFDADTTPHIKESPFSAGTLGSEPLSNSSSENDLKSSLKRLFTSANLSKVFDSNFNFKIPIPTEGESKDGEADGPNSGFDSPLGEHDGGQGLGSSCYVHWFVYFRLFLLAIVLYQSQISLSLLVCPNGQFEHDRLLGCEMLTDVPLCLAQPFVPTNSGYDNIDPILIHKEKARGNVLDTKSTAQYVQRSKPYNFHLENSPEIQHQVYLEMRMHYANGSHFLTVFFIVLHMYRSRLRTTSKLHRYRRCTVSAAVTRRANRERHAKNFAHLLDKQLIASSTRPPSGKDGSQDYPEMSLVPGRQDPVQDLKRLLVIIFTVFFKLHPEFTSAAPNWFILLRRYRLAIDFAYKFILIVSSRHGVDLTDIRLLIRTNSDNSSHSTCDAGTQFLSVLPSCVFPPILDMIASSQPTLPSHQSTRKNTPTTEEVRMAEDVMLCLVKKVPGMMGVRENRDKRTVVHFTTYPPQLITPCQEHASDSVSTQGADSAPKQENPTPIPPTLDSELQLHSLISGNPPEAKPDFPTERLSLESDCFSSAETEEESMSVVSLSADRSLPCPATENQTRLPRDTIRNIEEQVVWDSRDAHSDIDVDSGLYPGKERLSLTDPLPKSPDHTREHTDGGGNGSGSGCGTLAGGESGGGGSGGGAGAGGGGAGGGGAGGQGAGGSGDDGREDRSGRRNDGVASIDGRQKKVKPKKRCLHDDQQSPESGYKTKPSTSTLAPTFEQSSTPRASSSPHIQLVGVRHPSWLSTEHVIAQETQPHQPPPHLILPAKFETANEKHFFNASDDSGTNQALNHASRRHHSPPHPLPEHIAQENLSVEESDHSGASVVLFPRPAVANRECRLETQEHERPSYWNLIDGVCLVLETPGDNHLPPEIQDDDRSEGENRPPRCHHNPPPFLSSFPPEDVPLPMPDPNPTAAQVESGADGEENSDWSDNGD